MAYIEHPYMLTPGDAPMARRFFVGCDFGKEIDYTAISIIEQEWGGIKFPKWRYHLRALDRIKGAEYPEVIKTLVSIMKRLAKEPASDGPNLAFDSTGIGGVLRDYLRKEQIFQRPAKIWPVVFTSGEGARRNPETHSYNCPKTAMVANFISVLQHGQFDYPPELPTLELLEGELKSFKMKLAPSGKTSFNAEDGSHDDLLAAIYIPIFIGEWKF